MLFLKIAGKWRKILQNLIFLFKLPKNLLTVTPNGSQKIIKQIFILKASPVI
jgi:hypothetical protein